MPAAQLLQFHCALAEAALTRRWAPLISLLIVLTAAACHTNLQIELQDSSSRDDAGAVATVPSANGVAHAGDPCNQREARACSGHDSKLPLVCHANEWRVESPCDDGERCDTVAGPWLGRCRGMAPACAVHEPGSLICDGSEVARCLDSLAHHVSTCPEHQLCSEGGGTAHCTSLARDECASNNGGCDPSVGCSSLDGRRTCGACFFGPPRRTSAIRRTSGT